MKKISIVAILTAVSVSAFAKDALNIDKAIKEPIRALLNRFLILKPP